MSAAATLTAQGLNPLIFHSRFTPFDRQGIETRVVEWFGRNSRRAQRAGRVLIATQVVEQSLDIDFDVMISDVAPIDLLIQRAGRLWRHARENGERPETTELKLHVLTAAADREPDATWVASVCPGTEFVYGDAGILWRTVRTLENRGAIESPGALRSLIESVYGASDVPAALQSAADKAQGKAYSARALGRQNVLKESSGYGGMADNWSSDVSFPTRLADPTVVLRLATVSASEQLIPLLDEPSNEAWRNWALSEVSVRRSQLAGADTAPARWATQAAQVRQAWATYDRHLPLLVLTQRAGAWFGELCNTATGQTRVLSYSPVRGLEFD